MDRTRFEEHLAAPTGRGVVLSGGHDGAAGGSLCGDLIRVSVLVDGDRVVAAGFDAEGCGALTAAGSAAVTLVEGTPLLEAARVSSRSLSEELGGLSPGKLHAADLAADALHRALGAAARSASVTADPARVLVAMSGGVDSAVAALLVREDAVAVTLELWRDVENDAAASCCSADAVRLARSVAHGMGMPHFTLDLRDEFRAGVVDPFLAGYASGETPNPCVLCNGNVRLDAMLELADRLGAPALGHGPLCAGHGGRPVAHRGRSREGPGVHACGFVAGFFGADAFPAGRADQARGARDGRRAGLPVASRAESQDLCFLAGTGKARFLERHAGLADRPGEIVTTAGEVVGRHRGAHHFTVGQRRGLGVPAAEPLYVLRKSGTRVVVGTREELATSRVAVRDARLHRPGSEVDGVRLRYHSRAVPCRVVGSGPSLELELGEPFLGAAPGQAACLLRGDVIVGWATIAA